MEGQKTGESKISIKYAKYSFLHGIPRLENNGFQPESSVFESSNYIPAKQPPSLSWPFHAQAC